MSDHPRGTLEFDFDLGIMIDFYAELREIGTGFDIW